MTRAPLALLMRDDDTPATPSLETEPMSDDHDVSDTDRLRAVWDAEKLRLGRSRVSQKAMALEWGVHPSNITQYLNGHIKLNTEAKLRFARYLGKPVLDIWPDFEFASVAPGELPQEAVIVAAMWATLPLASQNAVSELIRSLSGIRRSS